MLNLCLFCDSNYFKFISDFYEKDDKARIVNNCVHIVKIRKGGFVTIGLPQGG